MIYCECCKTKIALQHHHRLSQNKINRGLYGDLLDDPRNIQLVCPDCHCSHASPLLVIWSEQEFCDALGIQPRSKTARGVGYYDHTNS